MEFLVWSFKNNGNRTEWSHTYCLITCRHEAYFPILSPINFEIRLLTIANQIIEFCCSYT